MASWPLGVLDDAGEKATGAVPLNPRNDQPSTLESNVYCLTGVVVVGVAVGVGVGVGVGVA